MERDPDNSERVSSLREGSFWVRAGLLAVLAGRFVATLVLEGRAQHAAKLVFLAGVVLASLWIAAREFRSANLEQRCRSVGLTAFYAAWLTCTALDIEVPTVVALVGILAYALVLCVDMYRSLDAARPNY